MSRAKPAAEMQAVLRRLSDSPAQISRIVRGCREPQLHRRPDADSWSAREILAHLRACAEVWGGSIHRMLNEDHPKIRYVSPRGWINKTDYLQQTFTENLRAFTEQRTALVSVLSPLDAKGWARGATFTGTTLGREATVLSYAARIAEHELHHFDQLRRTVGT